LKHRPRFGFDERRGEFFQSLQNRFAGDLRRFPFKSAAAEAAVGEVLAMRKVFVV
jgi:hypothetical protein